MAQQAQPATKLIKPKTKKGKRELEKRAPKLVENNKKALILYGNKTSQLIKDVLTDFHKLKRGDSVKFTRHNEGVRPFEVGGESALEYFARNNDASLFALGCHQKKRPHNLTLGRLFSYRLYDIVEFGVDTFRPISAFGKAPAAVQAGNKPCFVFAGDKFDSEPEFRLARNLLLDFFQGQRVDAINLKGLDHVMFVSAVDRRILLRQYSIAFKRSGTKVPRAELTEIGPSLDLTMRRTRGPPGDLQSEALRQPKPIKKKVKNVSTDVLEGKVGRIYMPKQDINSMALRKMKGLKRKQVTEDTTTKAEPATKKPAGPYSP